MAKKKQIFIDVVVDDKGTTQRLAVDSAKLEKALVKSSKGALDNQRQMRGAAAMSSNLTKNFSKMTQGISGGIVPAYAELAARVFAVTAAFRFLSDAADTRNLIAGQQAFGAMMGTNYAGITKALQDATAGQLKFKDAAQATAIGTAAGLTEKQLTGLAGAAKNVSFALGRDLTDSFNRLIRGVTKAEPELLDELGIILRLEPATKEYAASIGKAAKDLNAFERSQAVANFVLDEAEKKFDKIAKIMDEDAFAVSQFGKAFDDLLNTIKTSVATGITPVLQFLSKNVGALVAVFGVLALPLVRSIIPNLDNFSEAAKDAAEDASRFAESAQKDFDTLSAKAATLGASQKEVAKQADNLAKSAGVTASGAGANTARGFIAGSGQPTARGRASADKALKNAEAQLRNHAKVQTGIFKGMDAAQVKSARAAFQMRERILKKHEMVVRRSAAGMKITMDKFFAGVQVKSAKAFGAMANAAKRSAKVVDLAFKGAGLLGIGLLLFDLGKMAMDAFFPMSKAAKAAQEEIEELTSKTDELNRHLGKVNELRAEEGLLTYTESLTQVGNAVKQANLEDLISQINSLDKKTKTKGFKEYKEGIITTIDNLVKLDPEFARLGTNIKENGDVSEKDIAILRKRASELVTTSDATQQLAQASKDTTKEINNITGAIVKLPLQSLVNQLEKEYQLRLTVSAAFDAPEFEAKLNEAQVKLEELEKKRSGQNYSTVQVTTGSRRGRRTRSQQVATGPAFATEEDKAAVEAQQKLLNGLNDEKDVAKKNLGIAKERRRLASVTQAELLNNQEKVLQNRLKISEIDTASQSFDAKRERLSISELNAESKLVDLKSKVLQAELARNLLLVDGADASAQDIENGNKAVRLAQQEVEIQENNLRNLYAINEVKEVGLDTEEAILTATKARFKAELAIQKLNQTLKFRSSGAGSIGRSQGDIDRLKRQTAIDLARENEIIAISEVTKAQQALTKARAEEGEAAIATAQKNLAAAQQNRVNAANELQTTLAHNRLLADRLEKEGALLERRVFAASSLNPVEREFEEFLIKAGYERKDLGAFEILALKQQQYENKKLGIILRGLVNIQDAFTNSISEGLNGLVQGTMTVKEAFGNMAQAVLRALSDMIAQLLVARMLMSFAMMGAGSAAASSQSIANTQAVSSSLATQINATPIPLPPIRYGGVMEGYRTGGIARGRQAGYPAMLHGTEAVIPMGQKKAIPVEFIGRNTQNGNNITINVSSDGDTRSTQSGDEQNANLGRAISMAVQEELQRQKRPGGILSPYGAA